MLLAIDTATARGSLALVEDGAVREERWLGDGASGNDGLASAIAALQILPKLDAVALAIGPGSFTGLRISLALIKGLALARTLPVVPISTLEALARTVEGPALAAIDARNGEVFARLEGVIDEGLHRVEDVLRAVEGHRGALVGEPPKALLGLPAWPHSPPSAPLARTVGALAWPRLVAGGAVDPIDLEPRYLQGSAVDRRR